jgi:hypothetical protein
MSKCSGYLELQISLSIIDFTQEIYDKNVIRSLKSTSNSISSASSEIVPSSWSSSSLLSLSTVCWFSASSSSSASFAACGFFGGQNHVSAGSSNPYTTVWKTVMFKTVLQQHSFQESHFRMLSVLHNITQRVETSMLLELYAPEKHVIMLHSEWDCHCNTRVKTIF